MGISRRNNLLAQYRYAAVSGESITVENAFGSYEAPGVTLCGKTVLSGTPSPNSPTSMTDALAPSVAGAVPVLAVVKADGSVSQSIDLADAGMLCGIPLGSAIPTAVANNPALMSGVWHDGAQYWISDTWSDGISTKRVHEKIVTGAENGIGLWPGGCQIGGLKSLSLGTSCVYIPCTHYVGKNVQSSENTQAVQQQHGMVYFRDTDIEQTKEAWRACFAAQYAAGTPVTFKYILSVPTITNVSLPDHLKLINGTNHIAVRNCSLAPNIRIEYLKHS